MSYVIFFVALGAVMFPLSAVIKKFVPPMVKVKRKFVKAFITPLVASAIGIAVSMWDGIEIETNLALIGLVAGVILGVAEGSIVCTEEKE